MADLPARPAAGATPNERTVFVVMKHKPSLGVAKTAKNWKARGQAVVQSLTNGAKSSQSNLISFLRSKNISHRSFWAVNTIRVTADATTIAQIGERSDVARIVEDQRFSLPPVSPGNAIQAIESVEWNIDQIRASEAWSSFGVRGEGIVVASIDTGAQYNHPALLAHYRGTNGDGSVDHNYNWYDPASICGGAGSEPCDNVGHGTHTMGTIVGDDGGDNQIGVAPGAKWITAKGCEDSGCSYESLLAAGQWMLAPTDANGDNPRPDLRPHIVSNSWGGGSGDEIFHEMVNAWVAAGIFPAFANGNSGDYCGSSNSPGDYPESYAVGAYDEKDNIAYFSSRGPSVFDVTKPNISAPGVNVRSAVPGDAYEAYDGTSMATPHVAGAVALLWSAAPALSGDIAATREILDASAHDHDDATCGGDADNNNVWGEGSLDVVDALSLAPIGPTGYLQGQVADEDGLPITSARVAVVGPANRSGAVDKSGIYRLRLPIGTYDASASAFGYIAQSVSGVAVNEDTTTDQSFTLITAPSFAVNGVVIDPDGAPIADATVTIADTPLPSEHTGEDGIFSFPAVPVGTYTITVRAGGCYATQSLDLTVDGPEELSIALAPKVDAYGYQCHPIAMNFEPGTNKLAVNGYYSQSQITLPFTFPLYGGAQSKVVVSSNGYVAFSSAFPAFGPGPIPGQQDPNGAIYGHWSEFYIDEEAGVYAATYGESPNRRFVIEYRNVLSLYDFEARTTFAIVMHENGKVDLQYVDVSEITDGRMGAVGIENLDGTIGSQYSNRESVLRSGLAIRYEIPHSGFIAGTITDANDHEGIAEVTVSASATDGTLRTAKSANDGSYLLQVSAGAYTVTAAKTNYAAAGTTINVVEDGRSAWNAALASARAEVDPGALQLVLLPGQVRNKTLVLRNTGTSTLEFAAFESGGRKQNVTVTKKLSRKENFDRNARTTASIYDRPRPKVQAEILDAGDVLDSFVPAGLGLPWSIGLIDNLWISDATAGQNHEFTTSGEPTGLVHSTPWAEAFGGDMAYDPSRDLMCQVAVGGDNGIHCWNATSGEVEETIGGSFPWTQISQRGLAYRESDDTFYIGGWNEGVIYHIKGLSYDEPGAVISSCSPADGDISGLAFNESSETLWVATNSDRDTIYQLNPDDCTVLSTLAPPQSGGFQGAGLELNADGDLWVVAQNPGAVYLVESGVPAFSDVPWLVVDPSAGTLAPGAQRNLQVKVDTRDLAPGIYLAALTLRTNSGRKPNLKVPVSLVVSPYLQGINAGGDAYIDTSGDTWVKDKLHAVGSWGYTRKNSSTRSTNHAIDGTVEQKLFQKQRQDPYAYRFDNVPNGVYEIDLRFAELQNVGDGDRLFDVIVENTLVLPAHDIQYEVGRYAADHQRFFVEVTDGRLDVRFIGRAGSRDPVINGLRVVNRPDR
jgi:subtilisin family serine protease